MENKNDKIFDLIFDNIVDVENSSSSVDVFSSIMKCDIDRELIGMTENDISLSSFEDRFSVVMDIKIINLE